MQHGGVEGLDGFGGAGEHDGSFHDGEDELGKRFEIDGWRERRVGVLERALYCGCPGVEAGGDFLEELVFWDFQGDFA